jgi:hypothetical protein
MLSLLDLPVEIRRQIYDHLFCLKPSPIMLGRQDIQAKLWLLEHGEPTEPTFHTALFRVSKGISRDALRFAYSVNPFKIGKDIESFNKLGSIASGSITSIRLYRNSWAGGPDVRDLWQNINQKCTNLETLVIEAPPHVLLGAVPFVRHFMTASSTCPSTPTMILDMNVLARHFSFDDPEYEYRLFLADLRWHGDGHVSRWNQSLTFVMRLPHHVKEIRFVMDVGAGAFRAFQQILIERPEITFRQTLDVAHLHSNGNKTGGCHSCFIWDAAG